MDPPFSMEDENVERFKKRLLRTKTIRSVTSVDMDEENQSMGLKKCLTTFDLTSLGVGSCCGTGMYVVAGLVAKNVAGPAVIFSFIVAAMASILSGVCYGEFGVRVPKTTGSAYMYSYVTVGEFVAFLIGWNLILEYMIGTAAGASALSACFDSLANHSISSYLQTHVGTLIDNAYPDFIGLVIGLLMTAIVAVGVKKSVMFNNVLNAVNLVVLVFIIIAGLFYVRGENWSSNRFLPYGISGVFSGAATCFYAFIGFDIIATTGEEAKNPSRSIPIAIVISLIICLCSYIGVSIILTLMVPYFEIRGRSALIDVFVQRGAPGAKYVVAIGAVCALTVSLLGSMFPMPRVIYAMSRDGLLFRFLASIHPKTETPLVATIITGVLASLMSLLVGLKELVEMMSIGTLLAYTLVSVSVLILRYQPHPDDLEPPIPMAHRLDPIDETQTPTNSGANTPDDVFQDNKPIHKSQLKDAECLITPEGEQQSYGSIPFAGGAVESQMAWVKRHWKIMLLRMGFPGEGAIPTQKTAKNVIIIVGLLVIFNTSTCLLLVFGEDNLSRAEPWAIILLLMFLAGLASLVITIYKQPQSKRKLRFMAPAVPVLPCAAMFVNIYLMLKLPTLTWARLGIWVFVGLLLYFTYSMWNSVKERRQRQKEAEEKKQKEAEKHHEVTSEQTKVTDVSSSTGQTVVPEDYRTGPKVMSPPGGPPKPVFAHQQDPSYQLQ